MATLGADLADVAAGRVAITLPIEPRLSQQDGFRNAGPSAVLDSACMPPALTLMPGDAEVLTVELKVNLLRRPAATASSPWARSFAGGYADRLSRRSLPPGRGRASARGDHAGDDSAGAR